MLRPYDRRRVEEDVNVSNERSKTLASVSLQGHGSTTLKREKTDTPKNCFFSTALNVVPTAYYTGQA